MSQATKIVIDIMQALLLTLLLISPASFADWGDVYSCQETSSSGITLEGRRTDYRLEKFQFSLDKTKNAMVFGSSGVFAGMSYELLDGRLASIEQWSARDDYSVSYFNNGKFLYAEASVEGVFSKSADCDKF